MIKYDYTLTRSEGKRTKTFRPNKEITSNLPNVVHIEGPNSTGKSTLLNILALAFHGLKKSNLHPSIKKKLGRLLEVSDQKLIFEFEINNNISGEKLAAKKINPDLPEIELKRFIKKRSKWERITDDRFFREYNLIYDIPINPLDRLKDLAKDIQSKQLEYLAKVKILRERIRVNITQIESGKDIDSLNKYKKELNKLIQEAKEIQDGKNEKERNLKEFKIFTYAHLFNLYSEELSKTLLEKKELDKLKKDAKVSNKELNKQVDKITNKIKDYKKKIKTNHSLALGFLKNLIKEKDEKGRLEIWSNFNIDEQVKESSKEIVIHAKYLKNKLTKILSDYEETDEYQIMQLLRELLDILRHYSTSNVILPGIEKSVPELIKIFEERYKKYEDLIERDKSIEKCIECLNELISEMEELIDEIIPEAMDLRAQFQQLTGEDLDIHDDAHYRELVDNIFEYEKKKDFFKIELLKLDIDEARIKENLENLYGKAQFKKYSSYSEQNLLETIEDLDSDILGMRRKSSDLNTELKLLEKKVSRLEKLEPHKYQEFKEELDRYFDITAKLERKLNQEYNVYIEDLVNENISTAKLNNERLYYYDKVSSYLANVLGTIRHIDEDHKIEKLDIIKREIDSQDGTKLKLDDFGTGQSQSAYLKGLLSSDDKRKFIVLFDEISHMDAISLRPIYEKLQELYKQGKLVIGILVQKGEELKVTPLIKE